MSPCRLVATVVLCAGCAFIPASDSSPLPGVGFQFTSSLTDETVGVHQISIGLSAPWHEAITVAVEIAGGSATPGTDYQLETTSVTFFPGDTRADVTIAVLGDGVAEPDETIQLQLAGPDNALIDVGTHTVTISANVLPRITFETATTSAPEKDVNQSFVVRLTAVSPVDVVVGYGVTGTAALGADHTLAAGMLVIPSGQLTRPLPVTIKDDNIDENDETVELTLTALAGAVVGDTPIHAHTIANDDPPAVASFELATSSREENGAATQVTVKLTPESGKIVTVEYAAVVGGTAAAGDYTISAGPLVFMPGTTQQTITLTPTNDQLDEEDAETVVVSLTGFTNATAGATATHVWSILDDDALPTLTFAQGTSTTMESGTHNVRVNLSPVSGRAVQFTIEAVDGTAGPQDYTVSAGPFTIPAGMTQINVPVTITPDTTNEQNETFQLVLTKPVNANLGNTTQHTVTINDNDGGSGPGGGGPGGGGPGGG